MWADIGSGMGVQPKIRRARIALKIENLGPGVLLAEPETLRLTEWIPG